ncbi:hypothetical protein SB861_49975 [Paraburkholderia sp. SIMBA_049]
MAAQFAQYFAAAPYSVHGLFIVDNGRRAPPPVSCEPGLLDEIQGLDIEEQRLALDNGYDVFSDALKHRGINMATIPDIHVDRAW